MNRLTVFCFAVLAMAASLGSPARAQVVQTADLSRGEVTELSYGIVELFDVNMPVTVRFVFENAAETALTGRVVRAEKEPKSGEARFDSLITRYSGRIFNASGDEATTITWEDQSPEWLAAFTPTVYPAPDDGRIFMELKMTVRWHETGTVSPDCGLYSVSFKVERSDAPEAVPTWADLYPSAFARGIPLVLARDVHAVAAVRAAAAGASAAGQGGPPGQRVYGATTLQERRERLAYLRAKQRAQQ